MSDLNNERPQEIPKVTPVALEDTFDTMAKESHEKSVDTSIEEDVRALHAQDAETFSRIADGKRAQEIGKATLNSSDVPSVE